MLASWRRICQRLFRQEHLKPRILDHWHNHRDKAYDSAYLDIGYRPNDYFGVTMWLYLYHYRVSSGILGKIAEYREHILGARRTMKGFFFNLQEASGRQKKGAAGALLVDGWGETTRSVGVHDPRRWAIERTLRGRNVQSKYHSLHHIRDGGWQCYYVDIQLIDNTELNLDLSRCWRPHLGR